VDSATPLIVSVRTPEFGKVIVDASDGKRHHAHLVPFSGVHCFPRTKPEWDQVAADSAGLALVWTSRFEVHVDQVQGLADRIEVERETA
jgi:hypothetical protein